MGETLNLTKRMIWNGPTEFELVQSLLRGSEVNFWILSEDSDPGEIPPDNRPCVVVGIERSFDEPMEYHLAVQMIGLKTPARQYFKYRPLTHQGEWVGCLDMGHKAYEGHSFRMP